MDFKNPSYFAPLSFLGELHRQSSGQGGEVNILIVYAESL